MELPKGYTLDNVLAFQIEGTTVSVKMPTVVAREMPFAWGTANRDWIKERVDSGKKPSATLEKCLSRIATHKRLLTEAIVELFDCFTTATTKQVRQSPREKAQYDMLVGLPPAMLRDFGKLYMGDAALDFVLPDEAEQLIDRILEAMKVKDSSTNSESNGKGGE